MCIVTYMNSTPNLITCQNAKCDMEFFHVAARNFPELCTDHADEIDRSTNGWTVENSVD
jgi:hypothetical protein